MYGPDWPMIFGTIFVVTLLVIGLIFGIKWLNNHTEDSNEKFINQCVAAHYVVVPGSQGRLYCLPPENAPGYVRQPG